MATRKTTTKAGTAKARGIKPIAAKVNVWSCADLKALIKDHISAHVKDVDVAKRLERALGQEIAYGTGGGGNVGAA